MKKAIVTVIGTDKIGITAEVCTLLAKSKVNILDINQTVMQTLFTMNMLVDTELCTLTFDQLSQALSDKGVEMGLSIRIQLEDIFNAMHRV